MDADLLLNNFTTIAEAPGGVARLRELILRLAVRGKLVPQDASDAPASLVLETAERHKRHEAEAADLRRETKLKNSLPEFPLPKGWVSATLAQVALVQMGNSPPGSSYNERGDGVPLINGPVEFSPGAFGHTRGLKFTTAPTKLCREGDLLVCVRGATTGRTNIAAFSACIGRGVALVRAWDAQPFINVVMWWAGTRLLEAGRGTTFPSISYSDLAGIPIGVPPLAEQKHIVARVDELMALCDELEAKQQRRHRVRQSLHASALDALTTATTPKALATAWTRLRDHWPILTSHPTDARLLRQAIVDLAVQGSLASQDAKDISAAGLLDSIEKERAARLRKCEIRERASLPKISDGESPFAIPPGWVWARFGEVTLDIASGWSPKCEPRPTRDGEWGVLKVSAVSWGRFQPGEHKALPARYEPRPQHEVECGDFLMSRANTAELVGRSVVVQTTPPRLLISDKILRVLTPKAVNARYLNLYNSSTFARAYFADRSSGTSSSMRNVSREVVNLMPVALPPLAEQERIIAKVDELTALCDRLDATTASKLNLRERLAASVVAAA